MTEPQQKALIYCRVSSKRQKDQGSGLDSQEHRCRLHAIAQGYEVEAVFPDDITGTGDFMKRPGMVALINYLEAHHKTDYVIIFDDLKRFARDTLTHLTLRMTLKRYNATVECLNYNFDDTPEGEFVETLFAAQGQLEARQGKRQTVQKMKARMEKGYWVFFRVAGYRYVDGEGGGRVLVKDEPLASIVTEALEGFASGRFQTKAEVKYFLETFPEFPKGNNGKIHNQKIERLLTQVLYAGYLQSEEWGISLRKAQHEPLISLETYQKIQKRLSEKAYAPTRKNINADFPLRGAVVCGDCGRPLTSCWSKGRNKRHPYYYCVTKGCESKSKSIRRDVIEGEFETLLKTLKPSQALIKTASTMFKRLWDHRERSQRERMASLKSQMSKTQRKIDLLLDRILDAELPSVIKTYEKKIKTLEEEKLLIAEKTTNCTTPKRPFEASLRTALEFLENPCKLWASERFEDKRAVLKLAFVDRLTYVRGEGFRTAKTSLPFNMLGGFDGQNGTMAVGQGFEPWELLHSTVFKTAAFDHSATPPDLRSELYRGLAPGQASEPLFLQEKSTAGQSPQVMLQVLFTDKSRSWQLRLLSVPLRFPSLIADPLLPPGAPRCPYRCG